MCDGKNADRQKQQVLFPDLENEWEKEWHGMPEFKHEDKRAYHSVLVNFESKEDFEAFKKLVNNRITKKTKSFYFPESKLDKSSKYLYTDES